MRKQHKQIIENIVEKSIRKHLKESWQDDVLGGRDFIKLYQGTTYEGLTEIIESGVIDARQGERHGETYGVNWFSLKYQTNYSRGFIFSIEIPKSLFDNHTFQLMNENAVTTDSPISIKDYNFHIEQAYDWRIEQLKNIYNRVIEKFGDLYEGTMDFYERFALKFMENMDIYDTVDNPIFIQVLREFGLDNNTLEKELGF